MKHFYILDSFDKTYQNYMLPNNSYSAHIVSGDQLKVVPWLSSSLQQASFVQPNSSEINGEGRSIKAAYNTEGVLFRNQQSSQSGEVNQFNRSTMAAGSLGRNSIQRSDTATIPPQPSLDAFVGQILDSLTFDGIGVGKQSHFGRRPAERLSKNYEIINSPRSPNFTEDIVNYENRFDSDEFYIASVSSHDQQVSKFMKNELSPLVPKKMKTEPSFNPEKNSDIDDRYIPKVNKTQTNHYPRSDRPYEPCYSNKRDVANTFWNTGRSSRTVFDSSASMDVERLSSLDNNQSDSSVWKRQVYIAESPADSELLSSDWTEERRVKLKTGPARRNRESPSRSHSPCQPSQSRYFQWSEERRPSPTRTNSSRRPRRFPSPFEDHTPSYSSDRPYHRSNSPDNYEHRSLMIRRDLMSKGQSRSPQKPPSSHSKPLLPPQQYPLTKRSKLQLLPEQQPGSKRSKTHSPPQQQPASKRPKLQVPPQQQKAAKSSEPQLPPQQPKVTKDSKLQVPPQQQKAAKGSKPRLPPPQPKVAKDSKPKLPPQQQLAIKGSTPQLPPQQQKAAKGPKSQLPPQQQKAAKGSKPQLPPQQQPVSKRSESQHPPLQQQSPAVAPNVLVPWISPTIAPDLEEAVYVNEEIEHPEGGDDSDQLDETIPLILNAEDYLISRNAVETERVSTGVFIIEKMPISEVKKEITNIPQEVMDVSSNQSDVSLELDDFIVLSET